LIDDEETHLMFKYCPFCGSKLNGKENKI
jgi:hypothetical protein